MKKLSSNSDNWAVIGAINDLIDKVRALDKVITRDIVRVATDDIIDGLSEDYYRTITLRIPRDKTIAEAVIEASGFSGKNYFLPADNELRRLIERVGK